MGSSGFHRWKSSRQQPDVFLNFSHIRNMGEKSSTQRQRFFTLFVNWYYTNFRLFCLLLIRSFFTRHRVDIYSQSQKNIVSEKITSIPRTKCAVLLWSGCNRHLNSTILWLLVNKCSKCEFVRSYEHLQKNWVNWPTVFLELNFDEFFALCFTLS